MDFAKLIREKERRREQLRAQTRERARRAAQAMRGRFAFGELYLWGSILGKGFGRHSDLDLVVAGMDMRDFHRAHAWLMAEVGGPLDVDLKAMEDLPEAARAEVRIRGVRLV